MSGAFSTAAMQPQAAPENGPPDAQCAGRQKRAFQESRVCGEGRFKGNIFRWRSAAHGRGEKTLLCCCSTRRENRTPGYRTAKRSKQEVQKEFSDKSSEKIPIRYLPLYHRPIRAGSAKSAPCFYAAGRNAAGKGRKRCQKLKFVKKMTNNTRQEEAVKRQGRAFEKQCWCGGRRGQFFQRKRESLPRLIGARNFCPMGIWKRDAAFLAHILP